MPEIDLGVFDVEEDAARAYDRADVYYNFPNVDLNFPDEIDTRISEVAKVGIDPEIIGWPETNNRLLAGYYDQ